MARRSASPNTRTTHTDRKWKECDHLTAIRARRYQADEIPYRH